MKEYSIIKDFLLFALRECAIGEYQKNELIKLIDDYLHFKRNKNAE